MADVGIKIRATDEATGVFGKVASEAGRLKDAVQTTASGFTAMAGTVAAALGAMSFATKVKDVIDLADSFNKLSQKTGIAVEDLSRLNYAAGLADVSTQDLQKGMRKLNLSISEAAGGNEKKAALFDALGVSIKDASGQVLSADKVFASLSDVMAASGDSANKVAVGSDLMGKGFEDLIPLANAGKDGLKAMGDEATKLGIVLNADFAKNAEEFNDNLRKMSLAGQGLVMTFGSDLVKGLGEAAAAMANAAIEGGKLAGIIAGANTLIFGTDQHINDVKLVEQTELMLSLEKSLTVARKNGNAEYIKSREDALAAVNAEIKTTMAYRKVLQDLESDKKAAEKPKPTTDSKAIVKAAGLLAKSGNEKKETGNAFAAEQEAAKEWAKALEAAGKASDELIAKNLDLSKSESALKVYMESAAAAINEKTNPAMNAMVESAYQAAIALESVAKLADTIESQQKRTSTAQEETAKERERVAAIGLTTAAVAELTATRLEEMATAKERSLIAADEIDLTGELSEAIRDEVAALRERAGLVRTGATKEAEVETARQVAAEWQRGWQATDQLAREVFADWAVDGSSAAKKIGDVLKKALLSAIYEATLKPIVFQVYGSIMGGGVGTASTASQMASSGSSMFGGAGSTLGAFGGAFGSGMSLGAEAFMPGIEMMTGATGMSSFMAGAGQAAGAGLAAAGPYVLAALAIKSLTDYNITPTGNGLTATLGANGLPSGQVGTFSEFSQTSSGILSGGNTTNRDWGVADAGTTRYISDSAKAITEANRAYGNALGLSSAALETYTSQIEINTTGMGSAAAKAAIDAALTQFAADQASAAFGTAVDAFKQGSETTSQTLARLGTDLTTVNQWAEFFGTTLNDVSVIGAAAAATLVDAFGGLDKLNASLSTYYQNYYTEEEQRQRTIAGVQTSLSTAGIDLSIEQLNGATKEGVRAWVDVAKSLYDAGIFTAAQLEAAISAANAMAPIAHANSEASATEQQRKIEEEKKLHEHDDDPWWWLFRGTQSYGGADGNTGGGDGTTRPMGSGPNGSGPAAGSDANGFQNTIKNWLDKLDSTDAGIESVMRKRDVAWASYKTQLSLAQGNDAEALSGITGYADTLITSIKESSKTLLEEQLGIARVKEQVGGLVTTKPEDVVAGAVTKSGQNIVDALFGISTLLGGSGGSGGSGQAGFGNAPRTVPIVPLPIIISAPTAQAPPNNSGMEEALRKMATRLEAIETNTGLGAVAAGSTRSILDELSNGARALKTRAA